MQTIKKINQKGSVAIYSKVIIRAFILLLVPFWVVLYSLLLPISVIKEDRLGRIDSFQIHLVITEMITVMNMTIQIMIMMEIGYQKIKGLCIKEIRIKEN